MKKTIMKLVFELMKDSKRSDRELLQPTVSRRRSSLVKKGMIKEFTVIPDFVELGYEIMAINVFKSKIKGELKEKAIESTMQNQILFLQPGLKVWGRMQ